MNRGNPDLILVVAEAADAYTRHPQSTWHFQRLLDAIHAWKVSQTREVNAIATLDALRSVGKGHLVAKKNMTP